MPSAEHHASTILSAYEEAQAELLGKAVVLTDGKAGTIGEVWLDELHGLRISIRSHKGRWPVSTIKFAQVTEAPRRLCASPAESESPALGERGFLVWACEAGDLGRHRRGLRHNTPDAIL